MIKTKNLRIKPKWLLSQSYNLFDDHGRKICEIIYPLTHSLMNRNVAYLIIDNEKHQIVDAIHHATLIGENKPVNTYIETLIKQLAAANSCTARKSSFSFLTTQSFPGSSGS